MKIKKIIVLFLVLITVNVYGVLYTEEVKSYNYDSNSGYYEYIDSSNPQITESSDSEYYVESATVNLHVGIEYDIYGPVTLTAEAVGYAYDSDYDIDDVAYSSISDSASGCSDHLTDSIDNDGGLSGVEYIYLSAEINAYGYCTTSYIRYKVYAHASVY